MASTYALPASAMTHSHGNHGHLHSHSHSPGRAYSSRGLRQERSSGSLHSHTQSEVQLSHSHDHGHDHSHDHSHAHSHSESHSHSREPSPSPYLLTPPGSTNLTTTSRFGKPTFELTPPLSASTLYDPPLNDVNVIPHDHGHHGDHLHPHAHSSAPEPRSRFTNVILPFVLRWPLLHTIMAEKDSRRIFYFMSLNFAFMLVQACYGFLTDSLGLLSDSIHMFFDCLALGVGLFAAIASKWPPSERFPYGFGKIESLSGFGNGVFLMLISIEIMIEATERLADGRETKRLGELFVVSAMGLAVNLVGMACFGHHGHAGHDHGGHSHSHDHGHEHKNEEKPHSHDCHDHSHGHEQKDHDHDHDHSHDHSHDSLMSQSPSKKAVAQGTHSHAGHSHANHSHSHDNENMHGIFLHVLADTMGSAAVMVSTGLIYLVGWNGWDPLASCVIAILIFLSSIPLIKSCAKKLLLTVPDEIEYTLRETLAGVSDLRGVASYSVPRFWLGDKNTDSESEQVLGVIHIVATRGSDLDDVRERARDFLLARSIDVVVQVEASGDTSCWCGGASNRSPSIF